MAYQTPPTFSSGNVLTAAQMNILSQNLEFFWSLVSGINVPFTGELMSGSGTSRAWTGRRLGRYLHYKMRMVDGTSDEVEIRVDGTAEYSDSTNRSAPYEWSGLIDLNATTSNPAIGVFYEITVTFDFTSGNDFRIDYFIESDSISL